MKKIIRNRSDEAGRDFWNSAHKSAEGVKTWPQWKKGGITVEQPGVERSSIGGEAIEPIREALVTALGDVKRGLEGTEKLIAELAAVHERLDAERARTDALVNALPRCSECGAPAMALFPGAFGKMVCDEHRSCYHNDGTPYFLALRDILRSRKIE